MSVSLDCRCDKARLFPTSFALSVRAAVIRKSYAVLAGLFGILAASCTSGGEGEDHESAELILTGAKIFTSNAQQPWAETVAIKDGRFIYVGDSTGGDW